MASDREPLPRRRSERELLDHIYSEGERYRRRRRRLHGAGALAGVLALAAGGAVAVRVPGGGRPPQSVAARGVAAPAIPGSSTLSPGTTVEPLELPPELHVTTVPTTVPPRVPTTARARGPATTLAAGPVAAVDDDDPPALQPTSPPAPAQVATGGGQGTGGAAGEALASNATSNPNSAVTGDAGPARPARSVTGSPAGECANSSDPACGPFRWEPDPGPNAALVVTVTARPRFGDPRTFDFSVVYEDPDATIRDDCRMADFGDGGTVSGSGCAVPACLATYGPWAPPAREAGYAEATTSHTFPGPGTYTVRFSAASGGLCGNPYASTGTGSTEVVVPG